MAKQSDIEKRMPKKKSASTLVLYAMPIVILLIVGIWFGYVMELNATDDGRTNVMAVINELDSYMKADIFKGAVKDAINNKKGSARKWGMYGAVAGFIVFAYFASQNDKRFHRRGEEHGSARWGTDKEKREIADTNDLYNNAILAKDIMLVIDRKKRELNAMKPKERKKYEREKALQKEAEKNRQEALKNELDRIFEIRGSNKFFVENNKLIRYNGSDELITIPDEITVIGSYAFANNNLIEELLMPNVKSIEKGAFYGCKHLKKIEAKELCNIDESAFEGCVSFKQLIVGKALKKIEPFAFARCSVDFYAPANSFAAKWAVENDMYCISSDDTDNEIISLNSVLAKQKNGKKIKAMLNLNMIILGGSGTGKSRFFVKPNLMQCNTSYVLTDPSGELLHSCGKMLERRGYEIRVFNIEDMSHSNNYNPFHYLMDVSGDEQDKYDEYGRPKYKDENILKLIDVLMLNTKGEGGNAQDPFWDNATKLLLSALIFIIMETGTEEEQNFAGVLELLHKAKVVEGKEQEKSELDLIFDKRKEEEPNALSVKFYNEFKQAAGKTMQSILISTSVRLQSFNLDVVKNLTNTDNIHLETLGDKKTALFIIIPSTNSTNNYLAAMMYTQLFDSLYSRAMHKHNGRLPVHVRFILDEFANVGKIPDFEKVLATCRKFEISANIILQNITQLKQMYEKGWEALPGNCDTMIYLGGKDQFTNEYLMKELGKETIDQQSINQTKGRQGSSSYNNAIMGRELMQLNELSTMDNNYCIVMVRGFQPFISEKYEITNHQRYNMLDEANESNNSFYIENVKVEQAMEVIDFDYFDDDNNYIETDLDEIQVNYISKDKTMYQTFEEIMRGDNISEDILSIMSGVTGVSLRKINV